MGRCICPLGGEGSVEPLDLAVGLPTARPCPLVLDGFAERVRESIGSVARAVVCHRGGDHHAVAGEERVYACPEFGGRFFAFVIDDLSVGNPRVVVDGVVQVSVAGRIKAAAVSWGGAVATP